MVLGLPGRPLAPAMRAWFYVDTGLVAAAAFVLVVFASDTHRAFAWTIDPPVTAAFLGVSFAASGALVWLAARRRRWSDARIALGGVWVFTVLTLVATLIHLDRFHLDDPAFVPRAAAWVWLVVYVIVPVAVPVLLVRQLRVPGTDAPRATLLPGWFRGALGVLAAVAVLTGLALFVAPGSLSWPWPLSPLTSRAVGAWLVGIGVIEAHAVWENEWRRVRGAMIACAALGVLQLAVLARYAGIVDWGRPLAVGSAIFWLAVALVGGYGWRAARLAGLIRG